MTALLLLGLALGLDSFRASLGLGLSLSRSRQRQMALSFGICDGLAPLVGLAAGNLLAGAGAWMGRVGPLLLGLYGCYIIGASWRFAEPAKTRDGSWILLGLPVALSADNFVAGLGLGVLQYPTVLSALVLGAVSGLMALAAMRLGSAFRPLLRARTELVSGVVLVIVAMVLGAERA